MSNSLTAAHLEALRTAPPLLMQRQRLKTWPNSDEKVLEQLHTFAANKKSGYERESAAVGLHALATHLKAGVGPLLLASLPVLLDLYSDKGDVDTIRRWVEEKSKKAERAEYIAAELGIILPTVENAMHDTKSEVSNAAKKCATALCGTVPNPDLEKHIPALVQAMESPANVPATIKAMSNTTFVAEVTAPSLAVLVPLLSRALNDRSPETLRRASIVTTNIVKLVRDPAVAAQYLGPLSDAVHRVASGASFPEVRAFAKEAEGVLKAAGGDVKTNGAKENKVSDGLDDDVLVTIVAKMPEGYLRRPKFELPGQKVQLHPAQRKCLLFAAELGAELVRAGRVRAYDAEQASNHEVNGTGSDAKAEGKGDGWEIAQAVRSHYWDLERVENFPPQSEVRAIMVEHALQGEDASLSILDFIASDPQLANISRETIAAQLREVGFDDERQSHTVGSLSGGWKMKLELARAMLYKADLLMLDEPTNHPIPAHMRQQTDRASVKWLEDYLIAHDKVTVLTVSHDSGFLDNITTDIIHYESKKLVYYPGNLSKFVEKVPEAKSYYTLAATSVKFSFPPPLIDGPTVVTGSRVGIIGPNGAGKSTLIKLLTGETSPQEGTVYKHPALRVGYVSQHATHHIERHLEKTAVQYIQWRFQDGHDRELLEKSTRVLTEEEKELLEKDFIGRNGEKRKLELIMGRQKLKKSFQYEVKWRNLDHKFNTWIPREELLEKGFTKLVQQFDDLEASREGAGTRDTSASLVRKHLEDVGLDGDIAQYNEMKPTNFLDREALGGLAVAIRDWGGAVAIISHNEEFVGALCPEIWNVAAGRMTHQGKSAVVEDAFADGKFKATPKGSGNEGAAPAVPKSKKKKLTRNQLKAQEERRRIRKLNWLTFGGPKPEDTDSD
ncbi:ABC transporter [Rhizoctonia solani]|uniref:ABC transporter n=1 Tax=Rhizoctonia solani TaxID=456999 RepID=A0A8H8T044_9AGAM|nr:ABC transporter [Rhizoctonia solani]QRW24299.1 ABC transporter [Rhizoctonia solani]